MTPISWVLLLGRLGPDEERRRDIQYPLLAVEHNPSRRLVPRLCRRIAELADRHIERRQPGHLDCLCGRLSLCFADCLDLCLARRLDLCLARRLDLCFARRCGLWLASRLGLYR